ncbi:hypothetical protein Bbelb_234390 [Branchiostoma belcheri]|nr:hypothetical protein Bbelb_234390 [Branchiostoma belcheri]
MAALPACLIGAAVPFEDPARTKMSQFSLWRGRSPLKPGKDGRGVEEGGTGKQCHSEDLISRLTRCRHTVWAEQPSRRRGRYQGGPGQPNNVLSPNPSSCAPPFCGLTPLPFLASEFCSREPRGASFGITGVTREPVPWTTSSSLCLIKTSEDATAKRLKMDLSAETSASSNFLCGGEGVFAGPPTSSPTIAT